MKSTNGERLIAAFETFKGILVLLAGFGLIGLIHHDVAEFAEKLIQHLHLDPTGHYPHIFLEVANNTSGAKLWGLASLAFACAVVRLLEGYGLWNNMIWAKWLAAVSGGIYVPFEAYEVISKFSWLPIVVLLSNISIVIYLLYRLKVSQQKPY